MEQKLGGGGENVKNAGSFRLTKVVERKQNDFLGWPYPNIYLPTDLRSI